MTSYSLSEEMILIIIIYSFIPFGVSEIAKESISFSTTKLYVC
jgi:hypothetical protein